MDMTFKVNDLLGELKQSGVTKSREQNKRLMLLLDDKSFVPDLELSLNPDTFRRLFNILIENAINHTHKGYVKLTYQQLSDGNLEFSVIDTGKGLSEDLVKELNANFSSHAISDGNITEDLSGAHKLAQSLGGHLRVESQLNMGTTVYFSLEANGNAVSVTEEGGAVGESGEESKRWQGKTVMIAEDEMINYVFLEVLLEDTGLTLIHANDGQEAVEYSRSHPEIDLVLMDIKMPRMNGLDATRTIKSERPDLPIIMQTAFAMQEDRYKAKQAGCNEYITKPIDSTRLFELIDQFIW